MLVFSLKLLVIPPPDPALMIKFNLYRLSIIHSYPFLVGLMSAVLLYGIPVYLACARHETMLND